MKKLFFTLCTLLISTNIFAQTDSVYFEWQPDGTMLTKEEADFLIIDYKEKTKEELFKDLLLSSSSIFNSPKDTISPIENQLISINAIQPVIWKVGGLLGAIEVNIHYVLKIHIKDEKIKIDAPYFTLLSFSTGGTQDKIESWTKAQKFFNSDGTPSNKKGRAEFYQDINNSFNNLIDQLLNHKAQEDW
ncbi:MAG: hypothetical protein J6Q29_02785 [Alistipes sp.]|nr:hypothetical protein [Alistipes sp.]